MTFVGEAVEIDWINGLPSEGEALRNLGDGSTRTLDAGADFVAGFYDYRYLTAADTAAVFALAIEATGGSASVAVSWGFDPTWNLDPSAATNPAGTHTVAAGITAVPLPGVSAAQYHAQTEELAVRVQVLSGSVTVDQVRLRVWPPGGPVGAFGPPQTAPAIEFRPTIGIGVWTGTSVPFEPSITAAQEQARTAAAADPISAGGASGWPTTGSTVLVGHWGGSVSFQASVIDPGTGPQASASVQAARFSLGFANYEGEPSGVEGVDWVYPPDSTTPTQLVGSRTIDWVQPVMTIAAEPAQAQLGAGGDFGYWYPGPFTIGPSDTGGAKPTGPASSYALTAPSGQQDAATPRAAFDIDVSQLARPDGGISFDILPNALWTTEPVLATLADGTQVTGGTVLRVMYGKATPSGASAIYTGPMSDVWTGWAELRYALTPAPFRVWDPNGVAAEPPLRQIQRDDDLSGFSAGSWTGASSLQQSNAWIGYR